MHGWIFTGPLGSKVMRGLLLLGKLWVPNLLLLPFSTGGCKKGVLIRLGINVGGPVLKVPCGWRGLLRNWEHRPTLRVGTQKSRWWVFCHSYLPWEGWTAACPCHLALVQLPGDLGYVLSRGGGGLNVIHSRHVDHGRARRRKKDLFPEMACFLETVARS